MTAAWAGKSVRFFTQDCWRSSQNFSREEQMNRVKQCTSAAFFMVLSWSAAAHPHSFISLQSEPVVKDGLLSAFKMRWTMDRNCLIEYFMMPETPNRAAKSGKSWRRR